VDDKQRYRKLRLLIKKLNKERKKQAKKIDILCNDFIAAQRDFIKKLGTISFTANFYESIVGTTDLNTLVYTAGNLVKDQISDANVAFFLRKQDSFELHMFGGPQTQKDALGNAESDQPIAPERQELENCFTSELVDNICKSNKICTLDDMFAMGLEGNLIRLNKISAATIPLGERGLSLGFILIYRSSQNKLTAEELSNIAAVAPGLSRAIAARQTLLHPAD